MEAVQRFNAILLADLRERMRTPRFWIVLGLMAWATWWCFPPIESGYRTLSLLDGSRGHYSSAWAGIALGLIYSTMLNLIGFYLVRGTLTRDIETRVWQLLVTTPMTRGAYLLAKWASHMAVFLMIAIVGLVVALAAQWIRAEDRNIDLIELVKPFVLISVPSLAITAMFAIWFDLIPWLRRTAGNVLFFIVWSVMLTMSVAPYEGVQKPEPQGWTSDPGGMIVMAKEFAKVREAQTGKPLEFGFNLGGAPAKAGVEPFEWKEWNPDPKLIVSRFLWLALAMALTFAAAPLLDWAASRGLSKAKANSGAGRSLRWLNWILDPFARGPLGILVIAELKQALRQRRIWWWLAAFGVFGAQFGSPEGMRIALLFAWLLPLDVLARGVLRERDHGTGALVFTAPGILPRLLAARFLVGFTMLFALSLPTIVRLIDDNPFAVLATLTAIVSIAAIGMALGALCRNPRPFELLMVGTVYACLNGATVFDTVGHSSVTLSVHAAGLVLAAAVLAWAWPRLGLR